MDRVDFLDAIKQGRQLLADGQLNQAIESFEAAHALYRGPFLEEDLYEEWTQAEREYLHQEYLDLLIEPGRMSCPARPFPLSHRAVPPGA